MIHQNPEQKARHIIYRRLPEATRKIQLSGEINFISYPEFAAGEYSSSISTVGYVLIKAQKAPCVREAKPQTVQNFPQNMSRKLSYLLKIKTK